MPPIFKTPPVEVDLQKALDFEPREIPVERRALFLQALDKHVAALRLVHPRRLMPQDESVPNLAVHAIIGILECKAAILRELVDGPA